MSNLQTYKQRGQNRTLRKISVSTTANANDNIFADTTASPITITLPTDYPVGSVVTITDLAGTFNTNNLTVSPGRVAGVNKATLDYIYTKNGWVETSDKLPVVQPPVINTPVETIETPTITASAFSGGTDTHLNSDWQISTDVTFTTVDVQTLKDTTNLTTWTVPAGNLSPATQYHVRARYTGANEGSSSWGISVSFTTDASFSSPWDLSAAVYNNIYLDVSTQETNPAGVFIDPTGTKLYIIGVVSSDKGHQYTLTTPWDISTATYDNKSLDVSGQGINPWGISLSPDGTKCYITMGGGAYQYNLSTPWDISTGVYSSNSTINNGVDAAAYHSYMSPDGTIIYILGGNTNKVYRFNLGTPYNLSGVNNSVSSYSVALQGSIPTGVSFSDDGTKMFILSWANKTIYEYNLSTPWDITTSSYNSVSVNLTAISSSPSLYGLNFGNSGVFLLFADRSTGIIHRYDM